MSENAKMMKDGIFFRVHDLGNKSIDFQSITLWDVQGVTIKVKKWFERSALKEMKKRWGDKN